MLPDIAALGKARILLSVNPDNIPSRKVHEKYAKRKLGTVVALRFLNFAFCKVDEGMKTNRSFTWNHKKLPIEIRFPKA
jgi:RimJ/RimL family protein N-acetyltransferase